jgi:hypothetical protein
LVHGRLDVPEQAALEYECLWRWLAAVRQEEYGGGRSGPQRPQTQRPRASVAKQPRSKTPVADVGSQAPRAGRRWQWVTAGDLAIF